MAASLLCSGPVPTLNLIGPSVGLRKSPFLSGGAGKVAAAPPPCSGRFRRSAYRKGVFGEDEVPDQFREENLKDGLIENFKNVPRTLYGLPESQMRSLFMNGNNHISRMAEKFSEERLASSSWGYSSMVLNMDGRTAEKGMDKYYMGMDDDYPEDDAPDMPSALLDNRIVYIGMPIFPQVTELIMAELMFLDFMDDEPIYLYLNCTGTQEDNEIVGAETDATAIADTMDNLNAPVYTMNLSQVYGQAAMLFAKGKKGHRGFLQHSIAKLHLPSAYYTSGFSTDLWNKGKDVDMDTDNYLSLLSEGSGKPKEELERDLRKGPKYLLGTQMIEYGIADRLMTSFDGKKRKPKPVKKIVSPEVAAERKAYEEREEAKIRKFGFDMSAISRKPSS